MSDAPAGGLTPIEDHAPDWLRALHEGANRAPHPALRANLGGMLTGWREWPAGMDFLDPASPNHAWKGLMTRLYSEAVTRHLGALPSGKVLDLACGSGRFLVPLARAGAEVHGLDATLPSLRAAQRHLGAVSARLLWADVGDLDRLAGVLDPPYDAAFAIELLCYVPDPAAVLAAAHGLLGEGAPLVVSVEAWPGALLSDPAAVEAAGPQVWATHTLHTPGVGWVRAYTREELADLLGDGGFEPVAIEGSHYVLDGPLAALADPGRLDGGAYDRSLLALEARLRDDPAAAHLPRAWLAVARRA